MATRERAIVNNLNERARFYGAAGSLSIYDVRAVLDYYDHACLYKDDDGVQCAETATSMDHVIPLAKGGANERRNLQPLCARHNKAKKDDDTDYRPADKPYCPDEYEAGADNNKTKGAYRRHDYAALKDEYINSDITLRALADKHDIVPSLLLARSRREGWYKQRKQLEQDVYAEALQQAKELGIDKEIVARSVLFDVIEKAVETWARTPKAELSGMAQLLKIAIALQGGTTDRSELNLNDAQDETDILERINRTFDTGEEARTYTPLDNARDETGAGWSD